MKTVTRCLLVMFTIITISTQSFAQWGQTGFTDTTVLSLAVSGNNLFVGTDRAWVFLSSNNGTSWTAVNSGFPKDLWYISEYRRVNALAVNGSDLFAGTGGEFGPGIFHSTDNGTSWIALNNGFPKRWSDTTCYHTITCLLSNGTNLFAGTRDTGVLLSTDNGKSWCAANTGLTDLRISSMAITFNKTSGTNLFAGTCIFDEDEGTPSPQGVFLSTDNGTNWTAVNTGLQYNDVRAFAVSGTNIFVGGFFGVFLSTDNGIHWAACGLTQYIVTAFAVSGGDLFAGTYEGGVFLSTNNGTSWTAVNSGFPSGATTQFRPINALAITNSDIFAGTASGVWRRPLSEMMSVEQSSAQLPERFFLSQNYPNPFNPATVINYQLPMSSYVTLKVYDLLGREVATLVNERKDAGAYSVQWDATRFASGIYFYTLQAGKFRDTKRMILIK